MLIRKPWLLHTLTSLRCCGRQPLSGPPLSGSCTLGQNSGSSVLAVPPTINFSPGQPPSLWVSALILTVWTVVVSYRPASPAGMCMAWGQEPDTAFHTEWRLINAVEGREAEEQECRDRRIQHRRGNYGSRTRRWNWKPGGMSRAHVQQPVGVSGGWLGPTSGCLPCPKTPVFNVSPGSDFRQIMLQD